MKKCFKDGCLLVMHRLVHSCVYCVYNCVVDTQTDRLYNEKMLGKNSKILTVKQQRVYSFICAYLKKYGFSPTVLELAGFLEVSSLRTVTQYLDALQKKQLITRARYQSRGIRLFEKKGVSQTITLPVLSSAGCDNMHVFAEQSFDEFITLDKNFIHGKNPKQVFVFRAVGDSMNDAGIETGDLVIAEKTLEIAGRDKVVAIVDGMALIKQINFSPNAVILSPMSQDKQYRPIIMKRNFQVFGKVIEVIKNFAGGEELVYEKL